MHIIYLFGRVWLGAVHQSPSLVQYELSVKDDYVLAITKKG